MTPNDEPIFADDLEHHALARRVGLRILNCHPPYVVGVCGSWGAGKTSFLHKLWAYLGGEVILSSRGNNKLAPLNDKEREDFFGDDDGFLPSVRERTIQLIWFNPWQHQFESSPLVALLHEIRQQFSRTRKFFEEAGKLTDVTIHTMLNMLPELGKGLANRSCSRTGSIQAAKRRAFSLSSSRAFLAIAAEVLDPKGETELAKWRVAQ